MASHWWPKLLMPRGLEAKALVKAPAMLYLIFTETDWPRCIAPSGQCCLIRRSAGCLPACRPVTEIRTSARRWRWPDWNSYAITSYSNYSDLPLNMAPPSPIKLQPDTSNKTARSMAKELPYSSSSSNNHNPDQARLPPKKPFHPKKRIETNLVTPITLSYLYRPYTCWNNSYQKDTIVPLFSRFPPIGHKGTAVAKLNSRLKQKIALLIT